MTTIDALRARMCYVTTNEALSSLGVTRQTICCGVAEGRIQALGIDDALKFVPAHLADYLEAADRRAALAPVVP